MEEGSRIEGKSFYIKNKERYQPKIEGSESSGSQDQVIRGIIDVVRSSDNRISGWRPSLSPRVMESKFVDDIYNEALGGTDFSLLTQMPTSLGGYFQFSTEKNWDAEDGLIGKSIAGEYFTLDLNLLSVGLQTIAFHKRLDFSDSWFSKTQISAMNTAAHITENKYQGALKLHKCNLKRKVATDKKEFMPSTQSLKEPVKFPHSVRKTVCNNQDKYLDKILNVASKEIANIKLNENIKNSPISESDEKATKCKDISEEIQQWLDEVLQE